MVSTDKLRSIFSSPTPRTNMVRPSEIPQASRPASGAVRSVLLHIYLTIEIRLVPDAREVVHRGRRAGSGRCRCVAVFDGPHHPRFALASRDLRGGLDRRRGQS
jgi:hypothetical protein